MKNLKNKIEEIIKKEDLNVLGEEADNLDVEQLFYLLEMEYSLINFSVYGRSNSYGDDFWFQAEHYSKDLGVVIIIDYNFEWRFNSIEEIVEEIEHYKKKIKELEKRITRSTSINVAEFKEN